MSTLTKTFVGSPSDVILPDVDAVVPRIEYCRRLRRHRSSLLLPGRKRRRTPGAPVGRGGES